jgi:hypothetical protein
MSQNENPNQSITNAKDHLSHLKTEIAHNYEGANYQQTKVDEIKRALDKAKLEEAKNAADKADTETLRQLATEIDASDYEITTFAETEGGAEATEFRSETQNLKRVVTEKIKEKEQPKTFTDRVVQMAEKMGQGLAALMERVNEWASKLGIGALNGLKMAAGALGFETAARFLDGYVRPAEVRQLIADKIPAGAKVVRDASDADAIKKLEKAYADEVKANTPKSQPKTEKQEGEKDKKEEPEQPQPAQRTFMEFCEERVNNLPQNRQEYKMMDLIRSDDPELAVGEAPDTNPNKKESKEARETIKNRNAKYVFALAEAFNAEHDFIDLDTAAVQKDLQADNPEYYKTVIEKIIKNMEQDSFSHGFSLTASMLGSYQEAKSVHLFGMQIDNGTLEIRDGNNYLWDPDAIPNFKQNLIHQTNVAIEQLLNYSFTSGRAASVMPKVQEELKKNLTKYKLD